MTNKGTQVSVFRAVVRPPDALEQFAMGKNLSGVAGEFAEQVIFGGSQVDFFAAGANRAMRKIHDQPLFAATAIDGALRIVTLAAAQASCLVRAAQGHTDAS